MPDPSRKFCKGRAQHRGAWYAPFLVSEPSATADTGRVADWSFSLGRAAGRQVAIAIPSKQLPPPLIGETVPLGSPVEQPPNPPVEQPPNPPIEVQYFSKVGWGEIFCATVSFLIGMSALALVLPRLS